MERLPTLLTEQPKPAQAIAVVIAPFVLGLIAGLLLGWSAVAYWVFSGLALAGGYFAALEHRGAMSGAERGLLGGLLFGTGVLLAHALSGAEPEVALPEPPGFLVFLTASIGTALGALGGRYRERTEAAARRDRG